MKKRFLGVVLVSLCFLAAGPLAGQAFAGAASWWAHDGFEKLGTLTFGGDVRVRPEFSDNMGDMGISAKFKGAPLGAWNDINIVRERARLWVQADMEKKVTAYLRMAQEIRWGEDPRNAGAPAGASPGSPLLGNESRWAMLLDNAWLQVVEPWDLPVSCRLGRQDLIYGQGFLIIDSDSNYNPDGSRTVFFDAAKATLHLKPLKTDVDFLFAKSHEGIRETFWENHSGDEEDLYGVYATTNYGDPVKTEVYLLVKNQRKEYNSYIFSGGLNGPGIIHPKRQVYTWGTRLSAKSGNFKTAAEFAAQTGEIDNIETFMIRNSNLPDGYNYKMNATGNPRTGIAEILAFAGYAHASYTFANAALKPSIMLGYWFYSGDDRESKYWGGFDDMYAQAPLHGEWLLYSNLDLLASPTTDWTPYMHSNMHFPKLMVSLVPIENTTFEVSYLHLFAHQNTELATLTNSPGGKNRGDYVIAKLGYDFSKNLSAHVLWEWFIPGNYFPSNARTGDYGRVEVIAKF